MSLCLMVFIYMQQNVTPKKQLLTIEDFLSIYSINRSAYYEEVNSGRLKVLKIGKRRVRIDPEEAELWKKSCALP